MPQRGAHEAGSETRSHRGFSCRLDGKRGWKDWQLKSLIIDGDWTFVTRNSVDFRGPRDAPGSKGQYVGVEVHAGLICLNGPVGMDLDLQLEMLEEALDELDRDDDLVNQVLEISLSDSSEGFEVLRYKMPAESA
jgi:hypothetical protein